MPATDDEIREKYLERAIRELNRLTHELQECDLCPRGSLMPVLGSGHPQADVFLLKYRMIVAMGAQALATLNDLELPLAARLEPLLGEVQSLTPTIDALYVPDIDSSLDDEGAKKGFWRAFRKLGDWYADLPPY